MNRTRIAVLVSGRGTNMRSDCAGVSKTGELPGCEVVLVVSNVPGAPAIDKRARTGLDHV